MIIMTQKVNVKIKQVKVNTDGEKVKVKTNALAQNFMYQTWQDIFCSSSPLFDQTDHSGQSSEFHPSANPSVKSTFIEFDQLILKWSTQNTGTVDTMYQSKIVGEPPPRDLPCFNLNI